MCELRSCFVLCLFGAVVSTKCFSFPLQAWDDFVFKKSIGWLLAPGAKILKQACAKTYAVKALQDITWVWLVDKSMTNPSELSWFKHYDKEGFQQILHCPMWFFWRFQIWSNQYEHVHNKLLWTWWFCIFWQVQWWEGNKRPFPRFDSWSSQWLSARNSTWKFL